MLGIMLKSCLCTFFTKGIEFLQRVVSSKSAAICLKKISVVLVVRYVVLCAPVQEPLSSFTPDMVINTVIAANTPV